MRRENSSKNGKSFLKEVLDVGDVAPMVPLIWNVLFMISFRLSELPEQRPPPHLCQIS